MTLDLDAIPYADQAPPEATPTRVLSAVTAPRRRTFFKAVGYACLSLGAAALTMPFRASRAYAEVSPGGALQGWDANDCTDAYPGGYNEQKDTHGLYVGETAACVGGRWRGSNWCANGWHRSGKVLSASGAWEWEMKPISHRCGGWRRPKKNAWRWTTDGGTPAQKVWRCSDGHSRVRRNVARAWWSFTYLSICRARVA